MFTNEKKLLLTEKNESESEDFLWQQFINGDDACYEKIYKKYVGTLFNYGMQISSNEELVKDAIQDLFVKLHSNRRNLNKSIHLKFYLFTSLKNILYNLFRREILFEPIDAYQTENIPDLSSEKKITESLDQSSDQQRFNQLLSVLTVRQREIIYYRYVQDFSIEEISLLTNMNYQSVQNNIQRALKKMREFNIPIIILPLLKWIIN